MRVTKRRRGCCGCAGAEARRSTRTSASWCLPEDFDDEAGHKTQGRAFPSHWPGVPPLARCSAAQPEPRFPTRRCRAPSPASSTASPSSAIFGIEIFLSPTRLGHALERMPFLFNFRSEVGRLSQCDHAGGRRRPGLASARSLRMARARALRGRLRAHRDAGRAADGAHLPARRSGDPRPPGGPAGSGNGPCATSCSAAATVPAWRSGSSCSSTSSARRALPNRSVRMRSIASSAKCGRAAPIHLYAIESGPDTDRPPTRQPD